uniref:Uncharacterized protein n=1 Tax=Oryza brachyantha TaxID=4533 RepID=J3KZT7_ORYBR
MEGRLGIEPMFPVLEDIHVKNCPNLTLLPEAPYLRILKLKENKPHLSQSIVGSRYMSSLSHIKLSISDTETTLPQPDQSFVHSEYGNNILNHEASVRKMKLFGSSIFFYLTRSQPTIGPWKWCKHLEKLEIKSCDALVYWPEREFHSLQLQELIVKSCKNLNGPMPMDQESTQGMEQLLPNLKTLQISDCQSLVKIFILPRSIMSIHIDRCPRLNSIWGKQEDTESRTAHDEQLPALRTSSPGPSASPAMEHLLPCLELLSIGHCDRLAGVLDVPPSLQILEIYSCRDFRFLSGQLDALLILHISDCKGVRSLACLGDMPSLKRLCIYRCRSMSSLPDGPRSYSSLERLEIRFCQAMKLIPGRLQQRLDSLELQDLSYMRSSNPLEDVWHANG